MLIINWQYEKSLYAGTKDSLFLINLHTITVDFPIAINNLSEDFCIGFKGRVYRSSTLRTSSNSNNSDKTKQIISVFAKMTSDEKCTEIVYISNIKGIAEYVENLSDFLSDDIIDKFSYIV